MEYNEVTTISNEAATHIKEFLNKVYRYCFEAEGDEERQLSDYLNNSLNNPAPICHTFADGWEVRVHFQMPGINDSAMYAEIYGGFDEGYEEMGEITPDLPDKFDIGATWKFSPRGDAGNSHVLTVRVPGESELRAVYSG